MSRDGPQETYHKNQEKQEPKPDNRALLEASLRAALGGSALLYVSGLIAANAYFGTLHVADFSILRVRFILTGFLTNIPLLLAGLVVFLTYVYLEQNRQPEGEDPKKAEQTEGGEASRNGEKNNIKGSAIVRLTALTIICFAFFLISAIAFKTVNATTEQWAKLFLWAIAFLACVFYLTDFVRRNGSQTRGDGTQCDASTSKQEQTQADGASANQSVRGKLPTLRAWELFTLPAAILVLATAFFAWQEAYGKAMLAHIPAAWGGYRGATAMLSVNKETLSGTLPGLPDPESAVSKKVYIAHETDKHYIVKDRCTGVVTRLDKTSVLAVVYDPDDLQPHGADSACPDHGTRG